MTRSITVCEIMLPSNVSSDFMFQSDSIGDSEHTFGCARELLQQSTQIRERRTGMIPAVTLRQRFLAQPLSWEELRLCLLIEG